MPGRGSSRLKRGYGACFSRIVFERELDDEGRAAPRLRLQPDPAFVLLHDHRVGKREPLAGSLPDRLGGEERVEDLGLDRLWNSTAGVAHTNLRVSVVFAGRDMDGAFGVGVLSHLGTRVRGIHD